MILIDRNKYATLLQEFAFHLKYLLRLYYFEMKIIHKLILLAKKLASQAKSFLIVYYHGINKRCFCFPNFSWMVKKLFIWNRYNFFGLNRKHGIKTRRKLFCTIYILTQLMFRFRFTFNFFQLLSTMQSIRSNSIVCIWIDIILFSVFLK